MIKFYKLGGALIFENSNGAQFPGTIQVYRDNPSDTKLNVLDTARNILLESQVEWDEFFKQDGSTNWGTDAATTEANMNTEAQGSGSLTEVPVITSATTIELTEGQSLNYELTADYGAGFEWDSLPAGVVTSEGNVRKLIGGQSLTAAGSPYTFTARAVNYNGFDEETITLNVSAPAFNNTYSTSFNTGQYISMPPSSALNFYRTGNNTGQAWTVSFWFKPNNASNNGQTISYYGSSDTANGGGVKIQFMGNDNRIRVRYGSNNNNLQIQGSSNTLTEGVWQHVLCSYDGGTTGSSSGSLSAYYSRFKIFINGVELSYSNSHSNFGWSGSIDSSVFNLGRQTSGNYLQGSLVDEYALWNSDQSGNVADIYNSGTIHDLNALATAPDLWLRLGDGDTLPTFSDSAGSYDGVAQGMTAANIVTDVKS